MSKGLFDLFGMAPSALGTFTGLGAFGLYLPYSNYNTAIWGLLAGILSSGNLYMNVKNRTNQFGDTGDSNYRKLKMIGILSFLAGLVGLCCYLGVAIAKKQVFQFLGKNAYTTVLTNALTMYAGFSMFWNARKMEHGDYETINSIT